MAKAKNTIPPGFHTLTPHLVTRNTAEALSFYKKAFGAEEKMRMPGPNGTIMHAEMKLGDSVFMLADEMPDTGCKAPTSMAGPSCSFFVYVKDVDGAFAQALKAGATSTRAVQDMFWGDRCGTLKDPYGHLWMLATHKEDLTPEEVAVRAKKAHA